MTIVLNVNGADHRIEAEPSTPLLYALRDDLGLNGAKYGCGLGQCGACAVLVDGKSVFSCVLPISTLEGRRIRCGYCIPGMIIRAQALLEATPSPSEAEIRRHMQPHLCRCGTHMRILRAVRRAAGLPVEPSAGRDS